MAGSPMFAARLLKTATFTLAQVTRLFEAGSIPISKLVGGGTTSLDLGVGPLKVDDVQSSTGTTGKFGLTLVDNLADAFSIHESTRIYYRVVTADAQAKIQHGNTTTNPTHEFLGSGVLSALNGKFDTLAGLTGTTGTFIVNLTDDLVDALSVKQGADAYLTFKTANAGAALDFGNAVTNPLFNFLGTGAVGVGGALNVTGLTTLSSATVTAAVTHTGGGIGGGTGVAVDTVGPDSTHGVQSLVWMNTVAPAAVETALFTVPANSVVDSVQATVKTGLTGGGTTVTWSIGITGDVDAYGTAGAPTDTLLANGKANWMGAIAANAGASLGKFSGTTVDLKLIAAATGGTAAGDTALTVGTVQVVVRYRTLISLAD